VRQGAQRITFGSALPLKEQPRQRFLDGLDLARFPPALTRRGCDADLVVPRFELFKDLAAVFRFVVDLGLLAVGCSLSLFSRCFLCTRLGLLIFGAPLTRTHHGTRHGTN
jgi:hypothetical protein